MKNVKMVTPRGEVIINFTDDLKFAQMGGIREGFKKTVISTLVKKTEEFSNTILKEKYDNLYYVNLELLITNFFAHQSEIVQSMEDEGRERSISQVVLLANELRESIEKGLTVMDLDSIQLTLPPDDHEFDEIDNMIQYLTRIKSKLTNSESIMQDKIFKAMKLIESAEGRYAELESQYQSQAIILSKQSVENDKLKKENAKLTSEVEKKSQVNPKEISNLLSQIEKSEAKYEELKNINLDLAKENSNLKQELNSLRIFKSNILSTIKQ